MKAQTKKILKGFVIGGLAAVFLSMAVSCASNKKVAESYKKQYGELSEDYSLALSQLSNYESLDGQLLELQRQKESLEERVDKLAAENERMIQELRLVKVRQDEAEVLIGTAAERLNSAKIKLQDAR